MSEHSRSEPAVLVAARKYFARGWCVVPIPARSKNPGFKKWQKLRLTESQLEGRFFGNVGIHHGAPSGGLTDVDLDAPEAVQVGKLFLPATSLIFGRDGKPRSHWEYVVEPVMPTKQFHDCDGKDGRDGTMLLELRSTGAQTVWPPSIRGADKDVPHDEAVRFDEEGEPADVSGVELLAACERAASCALLARHWPTKGGRHEAALAAAGYLLRGGIQQEIVEKIVCGAAFRGRRRGMA